MDRYMETMAAIYREKEWGFNVVNVVYACNDGYVRQTIVSMVSVIEHNPMAELYLISDGISEENRRLVAKKLEKFG